LIKLQTVGEIASLLDTTDNHLRRTMRRASRLCEQLTIVDVDRPGKKPRVVYDPRGRLRALQKKIHAKILLPGVKRLPNSHGGVAGKNILTCARRHKNQQFVYCADIHNFYPSIHFSRVHRLFLELGCSDDAAKVLTRLCTNHHRVVQGFITSPILADRLFRPADKRIIQLCKKHGLTYTRFVDDVTISSPFDLQTSGIPKVVAKILTGTGFVKNKDKDSFGSLSKGTFILGLRVRKGDRPNASAEYIGETLRRLTAMIAFGNGAELAGPYYSRHELWGRLRFASWVNKARKREFASIWRSVDWDKVEAEADKRGMVKRRTRFKIKTEKA
jgi:hypothetical protein